MYLSKVIRQPDQSGLLDDDGIPTKSPINGCRRVPPRSTTRQHALLAASGSCVIKARLVREGSRLLTVVGLGGVKIRLALEGAAALAQRYTDGVCFVSLADTTTTAD